MNKNSRTRNSFINSIVGFVSKILVFIIQFICRTIFIRKLTTDYLGVNGLLSNILTILSLAELGVGIAIVYKLYRPIHDNDKEKIKSYLHFYKKTYMKIGIFIFLAGLLIIPFLNIFVKETPNIQENIIIIYILFLFNTSISYFFTYKRSIISGYQKEYIISLIDLTAAIIQNTLQIVFLIITGNYLVYIIIQIIGTIFSNLLSSYIANKMFPFIKEKNIQLLSNDEEKSVFKDVKSLIFYNVGYVISNGTDNIIISSFIGVTQVGLLSNYTTFSTALTQFLSSFFKGFTSSIGGLNVEKNERKKEDVYYQIIMICFFVYGIASIEFSLLINSLIGLWLGSDYLLPFNISFIIGLNLYVDGMRYSNSAFRSTTGLFKEGRYSPLIASVINIFLSIVLVKPFGIFGVLLATAIARIFIITLWDPFLLHKYKFHTSVKKFYFRYFYYLGCYIVSFAICNNIINYIYLKGFIGLLLMGLLIIPVCLLLFISFSFWMEEFRDLLNRLNQIINKKRGVKDEFKN